MTNNPIHHRSPSQSLVKEEFVPEAPETVWIWDDTRNDGTRDKSWSRYDAGDGATQYVRADIAAPAPQWQPIETAPRDGTEILLCYPPSGYDPDFSIARWDGKNWAARCDGMNVIEYMSDFGTEYLTVFAKHWMPLPQPPENQP